MNRPYLFTSESVSEGHPDKVCDRISDMVVDTYLSENDNFSRVGCETLTTTNLVVLAGEVRGRKIDKENLEFKVRECIKDIGYEQDGFHWEKCKIFNYLHEQSADIAIGVDAGSNKDEGAGDQGIGPAAGFSSTVDDLAKFASWQFRLLENGGNEIINANTLREMHRVHFLDEDWQPAWGLGFSVWQDDDKKFIGHGGSCPGYRSQLLIQSNNKIATVFMTNASGVNSRMFAQQVYKIFSPALKATNSEDEIKSLKPEFEKYLGHYSEAPWGGETAVISWEGELAMVGLPTTSPVKGITKLKYIEDGTFRRIRDDDELGEEIIFETDNSGKVIRMWQHQNFAPKFR